MSIFNSDKKIWAKNSDNTIVRYLETNEIEKQSYFVIESIVALANSDGGKIIIGCKTRFSKKKMPAKGGITEELKPLYENGIKSIIESVPNYVENFTSNLVYISWDRHAYSTDYLVIHVKSYEKSLLTLKWPQKKDVVLIRENGVTVKYEPTNLSINSKRKRVKYNILKPIVEHPDIKNYKLINIQYLLEHAYKYMTLEAFTLSMLNGTWQFAEPTKWNDEYEGRFYRADYGALKVSNCPPKLFATCITGEKASEAAWKVYSHGQGLGSKCVQIKINMHRLRQELSIGISNNCFGTEGTIYEGTVFYDLSDQEIDKLNETVGAYYDVFFDNFNTDSFLKLLLIKRKAYEYEKETRLFFVPKDYQTIDRTLRSGKGEVKNVKVNWKDIIEEIRVDKSCSQAELETIKYVCEHAHIKIHHPKKRGRKKADEIPLILFNVDKMEGRKKITIYPKKA